MQRLPARASEAGTCEWRWPQRAAALGTGKGGAASEATAACTVGQLLSFYSKCSLYLRMTQLSFTISNLRSETPMNLALAINVHLLPF